MERFETTGLSKVNLQTGALTCCEGAQPKCQSLYRCRLLGFDDLGGTMSRAEEEMCSLLSFSGAESAPPQAGWTWDAGQSEPSARGLPGSPGASQVPFSAFSGCLRDLQQPCERVWGADSAGVCCFLQASRCLPACGSWSLQNVHFPKSLAAGVLRMNWVPSSTFM